MALLAIDIGNTNIHLGLWRSGMWSLSWRARTVADKMPDEYGVLVRNFLNSAGVGYAEVTGVVIGSVVPALTLSFQELVERYFQQEPLFVTSKVNLGLPIALDQPEQAGADRLANAAAVVALYGGGPTIVVDFGTATNFDVVNAANEYVGGALAPGVSVAADALVSRAARLHKVELQPPPDAIGRNTIHAMQSGIFWGYVGLIEGLVSRIRASLGAPDAQVLATGGLAPLIARHTTTIDRIVPELTLDGLRVVYQLNRGTTDE
ncbi:type III pantothenate kinase [Aggregatilineales bacterium SYSU G02658]